MRVFAGVPFSYAKLAPTHCFPLFSGALQVKDEMNKLWRKVFEANYFKSLDHRSFYFKQADKKALSPKAMMVRPTSSRARCLRSVASLVCTHSYSLSVLPVVAAFSLLFR